MTGRSRVTARQWSADLLELGEGGRWINGRLHVVDVLTGRLLVAATPEPGGLVEVFALREPLGCVAACADGAGWIAAAGPGIALVEPGRPPQWLDRPEEGGLTPMRMNDGAVDTAGRFWAGSMAVEGTPAAGSLYRVGHDGSVEHVLDGISIPNGPAFSPDGRYMYLADTAEGTVDRFTLEADGGLGDRQPFLRLPSADGQPDGMTVDTAGGLWVALWGGSAVRRYRPDGTLDKVIGVTARQPTSVCLGGSARRDVYGTSASVGLPDAGPADGAIFRAEADVPGVPDRAWGRQ